MVQNLSEESLRDAHSLYIARLKKGVEKERLMLRREIKKREDKLREKQRIDSMKESNKKTKKSRVFAGKGSSFGAAEL